MERTMSVEDKIKRAEEIYYKRKAGSQEYINNVRIKQQPQRDFKLLKKMVIQILVCLAIYSGYYFIHNNQSVFSEDVINKTKEILNYDVNFVEMYKQILYQIQKQNLENNENNIGGANQDDKLDKQQNVDVTKEQELEEKKIQEKGDKKEKISQGEQDIIDIKNNISFIKPIEGTVSSTYGTRNPTTSTVPKNHTGLDIAATQGTKIRSSTDGEVVLVSSKGDFGNHLKIRNKDVDIIYAHCKKIYVKQGDKIKQGQEIGEVGSTGNSTGPHLHFEIRKQDRLVDPQSILEF